MVPTVLTTPVDPSTENVSRNGELGLSWNVTCALDGESMSVALSCRINVPVLTFSSMLAV